MEDWYKEYNKPDSDDEDAEPLEIPNIDEQILDVIKANATAQKYAKRRMDEIEKLKKENKEITELKRYNEIYAEKITKLEKEIRLLKYDAELMEKHLP